MSKYVLDPSGKIIKENNPVGAGSVTREMLEKQVNHFTLDKPKNVNLPTDFRDDKNISSSIVKSEQPVFENSSIFPQKSNSQDIENFLINSSFGADDPVSYYKPYNSAFSEKDVDRRIYAEELEMLAGIDLNSLGLIASPKGSDFSFLTYILDYLISSIVYLGTYWVFIDPLRKSKFVPTALNKYFNKLLPLRSEMKDRGFLTLVNCYLIGFDKFINTDPKLKGLLNLWYDVENDAEDRELVQKNFYGLHTFGLMLNYIFNNVLSLSKVGRNRFFILRRKFQQEAYWHSRLLYKAKNSDDLGRNGITEENALDRFFVEFSQYYFKFMLERINIGYLAIYRSELIATSKIKGSGLNKLDTHSRLWDPSRTGFDKEKDKKDQEKRNEYNNNHLANTKFKTSIKSLPQLLKISSTSWLKLNNKKLLPKSTLAKFSKEFHSKRIPQEKVKAIEGQLNKEYMPFYFHDLRTNEIIAMHAFLDQISDSFSPEYTSSSGYGRIDDVKHYVKTTRSINLTFLLYSMEENDFDLMWYQVNKIVSMVYPQWSQGIPSNNEKLGKNFRFPFTQVPTSSPLIRLRVGDVIKSNYSKENLKRLHGNKKVFKNNQKLVANIEDSVKKEITDAKINGKTNNPYTKAFETSGGQGLAGFITNLGVDFQEYVWNTNMPGSNAPHGVKITLGFAPIHDIPPGLDHNGMMRSAVYGVGKINKAMFEDD